MVGNEAIEQLRNSIRGEVLVPEDDGYNPAREVFNAMINRKPALIARCTSAGDVIACVRLARENHLLVAVRGGAHSVAGKGVCDGGLMIDLSRMKGVRVDPARRTVRAECGLTLGDFDRETQAFGLATTMGVASTTGIAGLTLGGGLGWLMGKYGLACDNLSSVDIVTADGSLHIASASENEDLFWGVRGGGGNFGVVTSLEYRLHEVGPVLGGAVVYPLAKAREVLHFYREFTNACPDELTTHALALTTQAELPGVGVGVPIVAIGGCYCGSLTEGEKILKPLRTFGEPIADIFGPIPYVALQSMFDDPYFLPGRQQYWKSNFLETLSDEAIDTFVNCSVNRSSSMTAVWLEHIHGAVSRVGPSETAFAHRQHPYNFSIFSIWSDPADDEKNITWTRTSWDAMQPFMAAGAYVNYLEEEGDTKARSAYGPNYERLVALKNKYDPTNLFRLNANIVPTVA